jgi:cytochrome c oxidase subunit 2
MSSTPRTRLPLGLLPGVVLLILVAGIVVIAVVVTGKDPVQLGRELLRPLYPPEPVTAQGDEIRSLYDIVFAIAAVIFFVVEGLIIWTVLRYRRRPDDVDLPAQTHGHFGAEMVWTIIPTIIVAVLFVVSWQTLNSIEAVSREPDVRVRAVAGQFQWTFEYLSPDGGDVEFTQLVPTGETGGMFLPVDRSVQLHLASQDVIHAWYVPEFLFKRDVVPGVENVFEFRINADDVGSVFHGQCAELCGAGHRVMLFDVHALSAGDYETWFAQQVERANATPPPTPSGQPPGEVVEVTAKDVQFIEQELRAPAGVPFAIEFRNDDNAIPHDVGIRPPGGATIFQGETFNGIDSRTYAVPAIDAGTYEFFCSVHPNMVGTLTVGQ